MASIEIQLSNILLLLITAEANFYWRAIRLEIKGRQSFRPLKPRAVRGHEGPRWLKQIVIEINDMDAKIHDDARACAVFAKPAPDSNGHSVSLPQDG